MVETAIENEVRKYIDIAKTYYKVEIPSPTIEISNRMTNTAGKCLYYRHYKKFKLVFSNPIIKNNDFKAYCNGVVSHEVAHIIQQVIFGSMNHGETFKFIMGEVFKITGEDSLRTHNFVTKSNRSPYIYMCPKCKQTYKIGAIRHNKIMNGGICYDSCGEKYPIVFFKKEC